MSGSLLRLFLLAGAVVIIYMMIMQPRQLRRLGRRARFVGMLYVAALLISAGLRVAFGWGT
jgi:hypothetical protein